MEILIHTLNHTLMITLFVCVMMMFVDYIEVLTQGKMSKMIKGGYWRQYIMASGLAATPGCLGIFINVSFYIHGLLTFGALVGGMIATCGDEAFVMLAVMPQKALLLFEILFGLGILSAWVIDKVSPILRIKPTSECQLSELHLEECYLLNPGEIILELRKMSFTRFLLLNILVVFLCLIYFGIIDIEEDWERITLLAMLLSAIFMVITVPGHYLEEHIWQHIIKKHICRIFLWTFFALLLVEISMDNENLRVFVENHILWVLLIAALVAIIPESGPHLIFVMMFAEGVIPFSVLLTNSIIQDGHGMLPVLSYRLRDFWVIKLIKFIIGLTCGSILYIIGL